MAVTMVTLMAALTVTDALVPLYAGALLLVALSTGLIVTSMNSPDPTVEWHRSLGGHLMAIITLLHLHVEKTVGGSMAHMPAHDTIVATGLQLAVAAYLAWTVLTVTRMWSKPPARLIRWEHLAMGLSVAVMAFAAH